MADYATEIALETDKLLAELGQFSQETSSNSSKPTPPTPPPPPPVKTSASSSVVVQYKAKKAGNQAGGGGGQVVKPPPPPRQTHVTSYTMQLGKNKPKAPPPPVAPKPKKPEPPPAPAVDLDAPGAPVGLVAYGPGLDSFELGTPGKFQLSCPQGTRERNIDISVKGPTGSKPVEIDSLGNGQFAVSYTPSAAGDHTVKVNVKGEPIPGSPFTVSVQYASFTDKCTAEGPGLQKGISGKPSRFVIKCNEGVAAARLRIHILGPSKAEPVLMEEDESDRIINVTYHPTAPGDYTLRVLWGDAHVPGSPFTVPVSGDVVNDPHKVEVSGDGINGGEAEKPLKFLVRPLIGSGPGPLNVRMNGPSKPKIEADDSLDEGIAITYTCLDPGDYNIHLNWGDHELPNSPYQVVITGEARVVSPTKCRAQGDGVSGGTVGKPCKFKVLVDDDAGPGPLSVSVKGPHPPKPIKISNNDDGSMDVVYHPTAPGDYFVSVLWGGQDIPGSPFTASVTGDAIRNSKKVTAYGDLLKGVRALNLATLTVDPGEGSGPGPIRALAEGPAKPELTLSNAPEGKFLVSFCASVSGKYKLYLKWGDDDSAADISGSPFEIDVTEESSYI